MSIVSPQTVVLHVHTDTHKVELLQKCTTEKLGDLKSVFCVWTRGQNMQENVCFALAWTRPVQKLTTRDISAWSDSDSQRQLSHQLVESVPARVRAVVKGKGGT